MKSEKIRWWLFPVFMSCAVLVDVTVLHIPILSFCLLVWCITRGLQEWKTGNRKTGIVLLFCSVGCAFALNDMSRIAIADTRSCRTVVSAVEAYTLATGRTPQGLQDLVPSYLEQLPRIRSPLIGKISYDRRSDKEWCVWWGNVHDWAGIECNSIGSYKSRPAPKAPGNSTLLQHWRRMIFGE